MYKFRKKQLGLATIISATTMLVLITLIVIASVNTGVMETRINTNEYRSAQAFLSAQAGIDYALTSLSTYDLDNPTAPLSSIDATTMRIAKTPIQHDDGGSTITTGYYTVTIDKTDPLNLIITSDGLSADEESQSQIVQNVSFANPFRADAFEYVVAPLISTGNVNIDGNKVNENTFIAKVFSAGAIGGNNIPADKLIFIRDKYFELDPAAATPWSKIFAANKEQIKHISYRNDCATNCSNPASMIGTSGYSRMHYTKNGNLSLNSVTVGSQTNPAVLIVDLSSGGNLTLKGNTTINGFLYVIGNWNNTNQSATINGAAIIDGNLTNGTNLTFNFDSNVNTNIVNTGVYTRVPGSWSDVN